MTAWRGGLSFLALNLQALLVIISAAMNLCTIQTFCFAHYDKSNTKYGKNF